MTVTAAEPKAAPPRSFATAVDRWASVGPYYAMFPMPMAFDVVERYTCPGDRVLDPFLGRGSSVYAAAALGRGGCGIEINPVGWVYSTVKLRPATEDRVLDRLATICKLARRSRSTGSRLPPFFTAAYSTGVIRFLLAARKHLRWERSSVDRTLMAFILVYLHGKRGYSLSNQLRDSRAMAPDYSIRWWKARELLPPEIEPESFLEKRIRWRYLKGKPSLEGHVILGDSSKVLSSRRNRRGLTEPFDLLLTSPPYAGVTNYHYDQWLRLWMLGWPPSPTSGGGPSQRKFEGRTDYKTLLGAVFKASAARLSDDAVVYVRTDARQFTLEATLQALREAFPNKSVREELRPAPARTQTYLYGDQSTKPGEVDLVLTPK